jgi:hypothetical protein
MTSPLDALASSPAPSTRRHCVVALECITGARCRCACIACEHAARLELAPRVAELGELEELGDDFVALGELQP